MKWMHIRLPDGENGGDVHSDAHSVFLGLRVLRVFLISKSHISRSSEARYSKWDAPIAGTSQGPPGTRNRLNYGMFRKVPLSVQGAFT